MTMHRLFDGKAKSYILIDVKTNSEESSCTKKLFLYGFLLSMLSNMNYVCIHSDTHIDVLRKNTSVMSVSFSVKSLFIMSLIVLYINDNHSMYKMHR